MNFFLLSLKTYLKKLDWLLFSTAMVSSGFSLVLIYSATRSFNSNKFVIVQMAALVLGVLAFFLISTFDFEALSHLWVGVLVLNLIFLGSVLLLGTGAESTGNNGWIRLGPIGIQPAELGKLFFIFTFATHLDRCGDRINNLGNVVALLAHCGTTMAFVLVFSQDLGMAITYALITLVMLLFSGMSFKWLIPMGILGSGTLPLIWKYALKTYQKLRILVVFDPSVSDKYAYHALQSKLALGAGGLWGRGFLQGRQTQYALLPAKHTDFIFAVAGEEFGFIGCMAIILLLSIIVVKIFVNAGRMANKFSFLMCVGIGTMFMVQTVINVGMCAGVAPVIGLTLPFFSYGGTSVVTNFCALGIVSALLVKNRPDWIR